MNLSDATPPDPRKAFAVFLNFGCNAMLEDDEYPVPYDWDWWDPDAETPRSFTDTEMQTAWPQFKDEWYELADAACARRDAAIQRYTYAPANWKTG